MRIEDLAVAFGEGAAERREGRAKPECHPIGRHSWRAVASFFLLEEGCHSAGFVTTIHVRHHLLLSIGWRFSLFAPGNNGSMSYFILDVNRGNSVLIKL